MKEKDALPQKHLHFIVATGAYPTNGYKEEQLSILSFSELSKCEREFLCSEVFGSEIIPTEFPPLLVDNINEWFIAYNFFLTFSRDDGKSNPYQNKSARIVACAIDPQLRYISTPDTEPAIPTIMIFPRNIPQVRANKNLITEFICKSFDLKFCMLCGTLPDKS